MLLGDISARKIAIPKLKGTPMRSAIPEVTRVPKNIRKYTKRFSAFNRVPIGIC